MFMTVLFVVLGYLAGSISSAILVCRAMGLPDPRSEGSRNPGATNVLRFGGKKAAAITLAGDFIKGVLPVLLAQLAGLDEVGLALTGLAAFLGHLYPVFFAFEGGKGVATAFGVILGLSWPVALAALVTWLFMAFVIKISSLSAIIASVLVPVYAGFIVGTQSVYFGTCIIIAILVVHRHKSNLINLLTGQEGKIGEKSGQ